MNNTTSSSSSQYNFNVEVNQVSVCVFSVTTVLIAITNTINIVVLCRRSLRSSLCVHYFLALAIDSLIYICFTPMSIVLRNRFGISIDASPFGCRIQQFFIYFSAFFFAIMLVCASIDRFFASSSVTRLRSFSKVHIAQKTILIVTMLLIIYMSPFFLIPYWNFNTNRCSQNSSTIIIVYLTSRVILYYIVAPLAMVTFGLLTIKNIRSQTRRVGPIVGPNRHRRTEGKLARVLIIQVTVHLIFSLPTGITYIIITFFPSMFTPMISGFRTLSIIWQQATFFLSFFFYILSAKIFRNELEKMFNLNSHYDQIRRCILLARTRIFLRDMPDVRG